MSQKEKCVLHCREQLQSRGLLHCFNQSILNHYYTKNNGAQGNAFLIGLKTADMMIEQYKPTAEESTLIYEQFNS